MEITSKYRHTGHNIRTDDLKLEQREGHTIVLSNSHRSEDIVLASKYWLI